MADWSNVIAGLILCVAFSLVMLTFTFKTLKIADVADAINFTFFWEGVFWALAAGLLTRVNIMTGNAAGAVSQTIICFGGIFFTISGLNGVPGNAISIRYIFPYESHVKFADVCPYFGITCFMLSTTMGLLSVMPLPKTKLVSPFWGVACFFIGAWLIGIFGFWGPLVFGTGETYEHLAETGQKAFGMPTFAWTWTHVIQLIGAIFLTLGGIIFGVMDNFLCLRSAAEKLTRSTHDLSSDEDSDA